MLRNYKKSGFTLIELLVVIAIIGVLASIILVALNSARNKGNDAKVKSNLAGLRSQAAVYFDANERYASAAVNTCAAGGTNMFNDPTVAKMVDFVNYPWLVQTIDTDVLCRATSAATGGFSVSIKTISATGFWCVDYLGTSALIPVAPIAGDVSC